LFACILYALYCVKTALEVDDTKTPQVFDEAVSKTSVLGADLFAESEICGVPPVSTDVGDTRIVTGSGKEILAAVVDCADEPVPKKP
jgi:hypothetical protein